MKVGLFLGILCAARLLQAQTTAFTYQGTLNDNGVPATGSYDLQFGLWNGPSGPSQLGGSLTNVGVAVSNGLFTVTLDFGNQFPGADRWLEIAVRTNGGSAFTALSPRQQVTPAPYAISSATAGSAASVAAANITGTVALGQLPTVLVTNAASGVSLSRPTETNPTVVDSASGLSIMVTNLTTPNGPIASYDVLIGNGSQFGQGFSIQFSATRNGCEYGRLWVNPGHDIGGPGPNYSEFQFSATHHIALAAGYGSGPSHVQVGIGGGLYSGIYGAMWLYNTMAGPYADSTISATNPICFSIPYTFRADAYMHGQRYTFFPGMLAEYLVTNNANGIYALDLVGSIGNGNGYGWADRFNASTLLHHVRLFDGDWQGTLLKGGISYGRLATNGSVNSVLIDFASYGMRDITLTTNFITLSTANSLGVVLSNDTYSVSRVLLRARGQDITVAYPNWATNGDGVPTSIPSGTMLDLKLSWIPPGGEANVIVDSARIVKDPTFFWDTDAVAYLARLGGVTRSQSNAINNFVAALKASGVWTNLDCYYPFCWNSAASNSQNMVSTSYTIGWHGTINTNDATGVHFDGLTGYGDTGWKVTNPSGCFLFAWPAADSSSGSSTGWFMGSANSTTSQSGMRHNGNIVGIDVTLPQNPLGFISFAAPPFPFGIVVDMNGTSLQMWYGTSGSLGPATVVNGDAAGVNVYLGARNYGNSADHFWGGKLQGAGGGNKPLTSAQVAALFAAQSALDAALGR